MFTRFLATTAALLLTSATAVSAQTADPNVTSNGTGDAVVVPLSPTVATVEPGDSQWIAINWTSLHGESRELKVTAVGSEGVVVGYPAYPVDGYSSGYWDDTLSESETDFTALKLTVADDAPTPQFLRVTVSWVSDTGPQTDVIDMPFDNLDSGTDDGETGDTGPTLAACDDMVIDSFQAAPWTFTFQARNTTSGPLDFEIHVPNANYELTNLVFNGSGENVTLTQTSNRDGTYDIVVAGSVPAWQSVGGQQPNGFGGEITPSSDKPQVFCG